MSKGGKWSERRERVWKEGRGVKWAGISQALRTRDRDVSRERDKKPLSRAGSVGWALSPTTFFHAGVEGFLHADRQHGRTEWISSLHGIAATARNRRQLFRTIGRSVKHHSGSRANGFAHDRFVARVPTTSTRKRLIYTRSRSETRLK